MIDETRNNLSITFLFNFLPQAPTPAVTEGKDITPGQYLVTAVGAKCGKKDTLSAASCKSKAPSDLTTNGGEDQFLITLGKNGYAAVQAICGDKKGGYLDVAMNDQCGAKLISASKPRFVWRIKEIFGKKNIFRIKYYNLKTGGGKKCPNVYVSAKKCSVSASSDGNGIEWRFVKPKTCGTSPACTGGQTCCNTDSLYYCADVKTNIDDCGTCGNVCKPTSVSATGINEAENTVGCTNGLCTWPPAITWIDLGDNGSQLVNEGTIYVRAAVNDFGSPTATKVTVMCRLAVAGEETNDVPSKNSWCQTKNSAFWGLKDPVDPDCCNNAVVSKVVDPKTVYLSDTLPDYDSLVPVIFSTGLLEDTGYMCGIKVESSSGSACYLRGVRPKAVDA